MADKPDFENNVINRLADLQTHLINFILPLQQIHTVADKLNTPIVLDDRRIFTALKEFREGIDTLINFFNISDIDKINNGLSPFINNLEKLNQTLGEIKYIGNRLNNIEKILSEIRNEGIEKKVRVDLTLDGHEMTRKKIKNKFDEQENEQQNEHEQDELLSSILDTLPDRESKVLVHRFGLCGIKKKTFEAIGKLLSISRERVRQIESKALRKLRHPTRIEKVRLISHIELRKAVTVE